MPGRGQACQTNGGTSSNICESLSLYQVLGKMQLSVQKELVNISINYVTLITHTNIWMLTLPYFVAMLMDMCINLFQSFSSNGCQSQGFLTKLYNWKQNKFIKNILSTMWSIYCSEKIYMNQVHVPGEYQAQKWICQVPCVLKHLNVAYYKVQHHKQYQKGQL